MTSTRILKKKNMAKHDGLKLSAIMMACKTGDYRGIELTGKYCTLWLYKHCSNLILYFICKVLNKDMCQFGVLICIFKFNTMPLLEVNERTTTKVFLQHKPLDGSIR